MSALEIAPDREQGEFRRRFLGNRNAMIGGVLSILGVYGLMDKFPLGLVMTGAMVLNLLLAAIMGVTIPLLMQKLGRDPAVGSSVMITAITDSGGFFIFLGLATVFLI